MEIIMKNKISLLLLSVLLSASCMAATRYDEAIQRIAKVKPAAGKHIIGAKRMTELLKGDNAASEGLAAIIMSAKGIKGKNGKDYVKRVLVALNRLEGEVGPDKFK